MRTWSEWHWLSYYFCFGWLDGFSRRLPGRLQNRLRETHRFNTLAWGCRLHRLRVIRRCICSEKVYEWVRIEVLQDDWTHCFLTRFPSWSTSRSAAIDWSNLLVFLVRWPRPSSGFNVRCEWMREKLNTYEYWRSGQKLELGHPRTHKSQYL